MWYWLIWNNLEISFTNKLIEIRASLFCKKILLPYIIFTGMSVACITFELPNILISLGGFSIVIVLKKSFFSKFWSYCNNAKMFSILNNSFQSRIVYVFWQRIKVLKLQNFNINYRIWEVLVQIYCNFLFIC